MPTKYTRFVDHDMFVRYRGGGLGHKYMWKVEVKYENMLRERLHGKQRPHEPGPPQDDDSANGARNNGNLQDNNEDDNGADGPLDDDDPQDDGEGNDGMDSALDDGNESNNRSESDESDHESSDSSDEGSSGNDEGDDSDEIVSEGDYDLYGLVDP